MNKQQIEEMLKPMEGKQYNYGGQTHKVWSYVVSEERERFFITTDRHAFDRPLEAANEFLSKWVSVDKQDEENHKFTALAKIEPVINKDLAITLKNTLLDNIKQIKENKDFIPQAIAIKDQVDSVISLAKTQLEYTKALHQLSK